MATLRSPKTIRRPKLTLIWRKTSAGTDPLLVLPGISSRLKNRSRRKVIRWGLISGNFLLLLMVAVFVLTNRSASQTIRTSTVNSATSTASSASNPLDQLSSAQIALQAAQMAKMPEVTTVREQADSEAYLLSTAPNDTTAVTKPLVVSTAQKSKHDIIKYTSVQGDTISNLAVKHGVSANSLRWSNSLPTEAIRPGTALLIPPAEGIVYKVKAGDTTGSIVNKYQANLNTFITVNDAEGGVSVGDVVWVPNGTQPVQLLRSSSSASTFSISGSRGTRTGITGRMNSCRINIPGNTYSCGYCTWWASYRRSQLVGALAPGGLGNASTWKGRWPGASSNKPQAGAIIWFGFGANHVGIVESVNPTDGTVQISEMNAAGWDVVSTRTMSASEASRFSYLY